MKQKDKIIAFITLFLAIIAEYFHLLFLKNGEPIYHSQKNINGVMRIYYYDDLVYFWTNETFTLFIIIMLYNRISNTVATKSLMMGLCFWFAVEWAEITLQLAKINDLRLYINDGSWLQLSTCLTIAFFVLLHGTKKT